MLPHTGQTYRRLRKRFAERFALVMTSPESSSGRETRSAAASGSNRVMSGGLRAVSHLETALSLTQSCAAQPAERRVVTS